MITLNTTYKGNKKRTEAEVIILGKKRNHTSKLTPKEYAEMCDKQGWELVSLTAVFPKRESKKFTGSKVWTN